MPGQLNNQWQANEYFECTRKQPMMWFKVTVHLNNNDQSSKARTIFYHQVNASINLRNLEDRLPISTWIWFNSSSQVTTLTHIHMHGFTNIGRSPRAVTQLSMTVDTAIRIVWHYAEVGHFTHKIRGTSVSSTTRGTSSTRGKHPVITFP